MPAELRVPLPEEVISVFLRFSRLLSGARSPSPYEVRSLLMSSTTELFRADGAAVFEVIDGGDASLSALHRLPGHLLTLKIEAGVGGAELEQQLLAACEGRFAAAKSFPLVSGEDLFGFFVLLFSEATTVGSRVYEIAEALTALAAASLRRRAHSGMLYRSMSELRATQEALAQAEKLRALGQLAAGVSHDLKNVLQPLSLQVQALKLKLSKSPLAESLGQLLSDMSHLISHGVETIDRLHNFSRQSPARLDSQADLNALLKEALALCRPRLPFLEGSAIELREEPGAPPPVLVEPSELVAAVVNLLVNAIEAMPSGGVITAGTGASSGGGWIRIQDNGPGMPPEVASRVFEPFFSTKGERGTGLGLATVYAFAKRHGGFITLDTALGRGTTFTLWLPSALP